MKELIYFLLGTWKSTSVGLHEAMMLLKVWGGRKWELLFWVVAAEQIGTGASLNFRWRRALSFVPVILTDKGCTQAAARQ